MKRKLHPGARWLFRIRAYWTIVFLILFFSFFFIFGSIAFVKSEADSNLYLLNGLLSIIIFSIISVVIIGEVYARMSYNRWFYELGKENIRLERGIIWKRYSNIPYERIQNIDILRGIIARLCGFSSLMIQTAGYSFSIHGGRSAVVEGYIPALEINEAEQVREFILKKIRGKYQDQGL